MFSKLGVGLIKLWIWWVGWCPEALLWAVAHLAARAVVLLGIKQQTLRQNLELIYGDELSRSEKRRIARESTSNMLLLFVEMAMAANPRTTRKVAARLSFPDHKALISSCDQDPRGVIFAVAHSGNFDLCAVWWTQFNQRPMGVIMKPLENKAFNQLLLDTRSQFGVTVFSTKSHNDIKRLNGFVAAGNHLCILPDQNARRRGVNVTFLGQPASTYKGVAQTYMANHEHARLIVVVPTRVDGGRQHSVYLREITGYQPSGDRAADIRQLTQQVCDGLSELVKAHPGSYLWHHKRWDKAWKADGHIVAPEEVTEAEAS